MDGGGGDAAGSTDDSTQSDLDDLEYGQYSEDEDAYTQFGASAPHDPRTCYGCRHCGERMPAQREDRLEKLMREMSAGLLSGNLNAHCAEIAGDYERDIRAPANAHLQKGEEPLPAWSGGMIRAHLLKHNHDPMLKVWKTLWQLDTIADGIYEDELVRRLRSHHRPDGRRRKATDDRALNKYCKVRDLWLKYARADYESMPFYRRDRHIVDSRPPNPYMDTSRKRLYVPAAGHRRPPRSTAGVRKPARRGRR